MKKYKIKMEKIKKILHPNILKYAIVIGRLTF